MLKIRLQRVGRKNDPSFRIVVTESQNAAKKSGRFLRVLGNYDPRRDFSQVDAPSVKNWIAKGARVSPTVHNLLVSLKIIDAKKKNVLPRKTVPAKAEEAPVTAAAETPPAEEVPMVEETVPIERATT